MFLHILLGYFLEEVQTLVVSVVFTIYILWSSFAGERHKKTSSETTVLCVRVDSRL